MTDDDRKRMFAIPPGATFAISAEAPRLAPAEGFAFVMNVSGLLGAAVFDLGDGHELRRARAEEIVLIKETVQNLMPRPLMLPWEMKLREDGSADALGEDEWRYYVITFQGSNQTLQEIEEACSLSVLELKTGFTVINHGGNRGLMYNPGRLFQLLDKGLRNLTFSEVSSSEVESIRAIQGQLREHDPLLVDVRRLVRQLQDLDAVPMHSPLRFLGYFAILESLLTHPPQPTDPYDSITRQIRKKLMLLNHRLKPNINYGGFGDANPEKIWSKMYTYRSALAHGGAPTFDGDLQTLRNPGNALNLLKETVKAVIRQTLTEPQLLVDLKEC